MFVAPSAYTLGGLSIWLDYLLPGLSEIGWDAVLALTSGRFHNCREYLYRHPYDQTITIENPSGSRTGRVRACEKAILSVDPDVVVSVNIPDVLYAVERLRARKRRDRRAAMSIHGFVPGIFGDARKLSGVLDGVVCVNRLGVALAKEIAGVVDSRVHYAPCGVNTPAVQRGRRETEGRIRLGVVGRIDEQQKRVLDAVAIVHQLIRRGVECELVFVGTGPDEAELKESVIRSNLAERTVFVGRKTQAEVVNEVYPAIDVLLVTSPSETGPLVALEAMAQGVPVASSRFVGSGLEGALVHGKTAMLFPVGDVAAAVECVIALQNESIRTRLRRSGRELIRDRYTIDISVQAWDAALRGVLLSPRITRPVSEQYFQPAGRLDRWFGIEIAESLRQVVGRRFEHKESGGEWPHAYGSDSIAERAFWETARRLDASGR